MAELKFSLRDTLLKLLDEKRYYSLRDLFNTMNPADIATVFEDIDEARDEHELALIDDFLRVGRPVLGICHGLQVLNVYFGGTLRQHIEGHSQIDGHDRLHPVCAEGGLLRTLYGPRFVVNSAHHQAVDTLGTGLEVLARANDGTVEAVGHKYLPVFAVQWHPERLCGAFAQPGAADGAGLLTALLG